MTTPSSTPSPPPPPTPPVAASIAQQLRNLLIILVATGLTVAVFLGVKTQTTTVSLTSLAESATPLEVAISNGKPSLMEFYANWCTSCQLMAPDLGELKTTYQDQVNFVMLNVDNNKWLPEMLQYRVDGIPHFVFLDAAGQAIAEAIGEQPKTILADNLDALLAARPLPHAIVTGKTSTLDSALPPRPQTDDPRAHGSAVPANQG